MTDIKVPELGESITSGLLSTWHVADGDVVTEGQLLYELETDKITSEGMAEVAGKISIKVEADTEVEIGAVLGQIDESAAGESAAPTSDSAAPAAEASATPSISETQTTAPKAVEGDFSPAVKVALAETGVDASAVTGTGKDGRLTKGDVLKAAEKAAQIKPALGTKAAEKPAPATPAAASAPADNAQRQTRTKVSPLRKRIAQRLVQSQHEAALLTTFNEADMSAVMAARKQHQDAFVKKHDLKLGFMSFFVKAVVYALQQVPSLNAQWEEDANGDAYLVQNNFYDIGVAVGTPKGLMVPVIRGCDKLGFAGIEGAIGGAAKKAREGKISMADLEGGCFTISNGGIYGSMLSTPIVNPPQSGILGMHTIQQRPVAINGQVEIRPMMYLALSYDHRIVDGQGAVTFLVKVKEAIENPEVLLYF